jgi:hypothetical protein
MHFPLTPQPVEFPALQGRVNSLVESTFQRWIGDRALIELEISLKEARGAPVGDQERRHISRALHQTERLMDRPINDAETIRIANLVRGKGYALSDELLESLRNAPPLGNTFSWVRKNCKFAGST